MKNRTSFLNLFLSFAKIGVMTFGGGYAMLPMLTKECVEKKGWATDEELLDYFAVGQCTPGVIAVNTATFIGCKQRGVLGGIVATFGVVFPSLVIITLLASVLKMYSDSVYLIKAFKGIRIAVCALVANSVFKIAKKAVCNFLTFCFAAFALFSQLFLKLSPVWVVLITVCCGLIYYRISSRNKKL